MNSPFEILKQRFPKIKHRPKHDCSFCKGNGIRSKEIKGSIREIACVCLFVSHDISEEVGKSLGETARRMKKEMQEYTERGEVHPMIEAGARLYQFLTDKEFQRDILQKAKDASSSKEKVYRKFHQR